MRWRSPRRAAEPPTICCALPGSPRMWWDPGMGANAEFVYVGGYTGDKGGEAEGIALLRRDPASGVLTRLGVAARTPSPSFLAQHPTLPILYAVNELDADGTVSAFTVAADGELAPLAVQPT